MSQVFKRTDQLKEQIFQIKLQMDEWKVLFATDGQKSVSEIASFLELDETYVSETLEKFARSGYVAANGPLGEAETKAVTEAPEGVESETAQIASTTGDIADEDTPVAEADTGVVETDVAEADEIDDNTGDFSGFEEALNALEEADADSDASIVESENDAEDFSDLEDAFKVFESEEAKAEVDENEFSEEFETLLDEVEAEADLDLDEKEEAETAESDAEATKSANESDEEILDFDKFFPESDETAFDEPTASAAETESEASEETDFDDIIGDLLEDEELKETIAEIEEVETEEDEEISEDDFNLKDLFDEDLMDLDEEEDTTTKPFQTTVSPPTTEVDKTGAPVILVVDDSVVIRKMVEIALENENYQIVSVPTGKEALNFLDDQAPDLIILDIMLSDVNGLDVLKAIKASKDIPVIMLSAKDTPRETTRAKELGADDFIPKPFKDEELVAKIKEHIRR